MPAMPLFHVIKYDGPPRGSDEMWLVWKYPSESIPLGSQLVVAPGQEVIFIKEGKLGDRFGPGTHTLNTNNIPLLQKLLNLPFGGNTPFTAEVYFVNKTGKLDMKWGTADPIRVKDPAYDIIVPVRAFGQFGFKINDPGPFVLQLVGATGGGEMITTDRITRYFRSAIITKVKDTIAETIIKTRVGVLDIPAHLEELSEACSGKIKSDFERFGLNILNFYIESISYPEDDPSVVALRDALARKAAKVIGAQADQQEIQIIGQENYRMKRSFDTLEKAAENEGGGGNLMGLGVGLGAAGAIGKTMGDIAGQVSTQGAARTPVRCPVCQFDNPPGMKFCGGCGQKLEQEPKICPTCKAQNPPGSRFCGSCGEPLQARKCARCKADVPAGNKFCGACGAQV